MRLLYFFILYVVSVYQPMRVIQHSFRVSADIMCADHDRRRRQPFVRRSVVEFGYGAGEMAKTFYEASESL
jgi:hypothetical protein